MTVCIYRRLKSCKADFYGYRIYHFEVDEKNPTKAQWRRHLRDHFGWFKRPKYIRHYAADSLAVARGSF